MHPDDDPPRPKPAAPQPRALTELSIEELQEYIAFLKLEEMRAQEEITRKKAAAAAAAAFFMPEVKP